MADVELQLIDRERNRFRVYAIADATSLFGEQCLVISWGRLEGSAHIRVKSLHKDRHQGISSRASRSP